jgi:hypothetical protein
MRCPRFCARLRPSAVRVRIRSRSTSASPPRTAIISRPVLVPVSAHGSASERNCAALGHTVKLMPSAYVKAYVKRNKNDAADAEAICEAVARPSMRFVPVKDAEQQSVLLLHRARSLLVRQRTMLVNALRAHMAEFGVIAPQGLRHVEILTKTIAHDQERLPRVGFRDCLCRTARKAGVLDARKWLRERDGLSAGGRWIRTLGPPWEKLRFTRLPRLTASAFFLRSHTARAG